MTTSDVLPAQRKLRTEIPQEHRQTADTRIQWLWMQRIIVVQSIASRSSDPLDVVAAQLILNAAWSANLQSIEIVLRRLEGGAVPDSVVQEDGPTPI